MIALEEYQERGHFKNFLKACMPNYGGNHWRHNRRVSTFTDLTGHLADDEQQTDLLEAIMPKVYNPEPKEDLDEDLIEAIEQAIDMCSDDSTAKRKTWTQGRKTALK